MPEMGPRQARATCCHPAILERAQAEAGYGEQRLGVEPQKVEVRHRAKEFAAGKEAILFWIGFAADDACDALPLIYRIGIF